MRSGKTARRRDPHSCVAHVRSAPCKGARAADCGRRHADRACIDGERGCDAAASVAQVAPKRIGIPDARTANAWLNLSRGRVRSAPCGHDAGTSRQAFNILHKIAEVNDLLRGPGRDATRVFEVHPELAFMQLRIDQGGPRGGVMEPKGKPGGHRVRKALLATAFARVLMLRLPHTPQGKRDLTTSSTRSRRCGARRIAEGTARKAPDQEEIDVLGLPMAIRY